MRHDGANDIVEIGTTLETTKMDADLSMIVTRQCGIISGVKLSTRGSCNTKKRDRNNSTPKEWAYF